MGKRKLKMQMIPKAAWGQNLHDGEHLSKEEWGAVSRAVRINAGLKCEICGKKKRLSELHAHEEWEWVVNKDGITGVQKLKRIRCLCKKCHNATHIMRTKKLEPHFKKTVKHYMKVNGIKKFKKYYMDTVKAEAKVAKISNVEKWTLVYDRAKLPGLGS